MATPEAVFPGTGRRDWRNTLATATVWTVAALVAGVLLWLLLDLIRHGAPHLGAGFFLEAPRDGGRSGGIAPILVSTALILGVALLAAVPTGLATALLLAEFTHRDSALAALVRRALEVLAGVPSIVFGLFGNALFVVTLGMGYSIASGGLTLACMFLPLFIRASEEALRGVSSDYRQAAAGLGISRTAGTLRVLLPVAAPGIAAALVLSTGRALAEAAALLFTSGYVTRMPESLGDSGRTLAIHVYELAMNVPGGEGQAYATAVVLVALLLIINLAVAMVGRRPEGAR